MNISFLTLISDIYLFLKALFKREFWLHSVNCSNESKHVEWLHIHWDEENDQREKFKGEDKGLDVRHNKFKIYFRYPHGNTEQTIR